MATEMQTVTLDIRRRARGRPRAPWQSLSDMISFVSLVRISKRYEIETFRFLRSVHRAWIKGESSCDSLFVTRRQLVEGYGVFLITQDQRVVAQFKVTSTVLDYLARPEVINLRFEGYPAPNWNTPPKDLMIKDLNSETRRFNLDAEVIEKSPPRTIVSKWGTTLQLSTATIMDQTGTISMPLWNEQIDLISVGDLVHIENARLKKFQGELQIKVGKLARLHVIELPQNRRKSTNLKNRAQ